MNKEEIPKEVCETIFDRPSGMSGYIVFRVRSTWARNGRTGDDDRIVIAKNAIDAISMAWEPEDPQDLRTINAEWLCPVECVVAKESTKHE